MTLQHARQSHVDIMCKVLSHEMSSVEPASVERAVSSIDGTHSGCVLDIGHSNSACVLNVGHQPPWRKSSASWRVSSIWSLMREGLIDAAASALRLDMECTAVTASALARLANFALSPLTSACHTDARISERFNS